MDSQQKTVTDAGVKGILWCVTFAFIAIMGFQLDVTAVVDEPGTIANAALLAGDNWHTCIQGIGGYYYKYGTALFYYPIYLIIKDAFICYKTIILMHSAMLAFIPVIAYDILRRYLKADSMFMSAILSVTAGIFPSTILYSLYARADAMLIFLPWLICFLMLESYSAYDKKQKLRGGILTVLLAIAAFYGYACHTRGVVFIIAVFCTVFAGALFCKVKIVNWPIYLLTNVLLYLGDKQATRYFKESIWYNIGNMHASAESFKFEKLWGIVKTSYGFKSFVKLIFGWAFNIVTSTYGLILIGSLFCILVIFSSFRKKNRDKFTTEERIVAVFGFLNFVGTYLLGCLFFYVPIRRVFGLTLTKRLDRLVYGRYIACALGIVVLCALYALIFKPAFFKWKSRVACIFIHIGVLVVFFGVVVKYMLNGSVAARYCMELTTFLELTNRGSTTGVYENLLPALIAAALLGLIMSCLIYVLSCRKKKTKQLLCIVLMVVTGTLSAVNYYKIRLGKDDLVQGRVSAMKDYVGEMGSLYEEYPIICIDRSATGIGSWQLPLRHYTLVTAGNTIALQADNMMLISKPNQISENFDGNDFYYFEGVNYDTENDVLYVKGEQLKDRLTQMGYNLVKYQMYEGR